MMYMLRSMARAGMAHSSGAIDIVVHDVHRAYRQVL